MLVNIPIIRGTEEISKLRGILSRYPNTYICGGYARYCVSPLYRPPLPNDIDVYCLTSEDYKNLTSKFVLEEHLEIAYERPHFISFKIPSQGPLSYHPPIQLINNTNISNSLSPEDVISRFDFSIAQCFLRDTIAGFTAKGNEKLLEDEKNLRLRIEHIVCPLGTLKRTFKYAKRGYKLHMLDMIKLFNHWQNMDNVLKVKIQELLEQSESGQEMYPENLEQLLRIIYIED